MQMQSLSIQADSAIITTVEPAAEIEKEQPRLYFQGLDSLRFYAAALVVIGHIPMNQAAVGLPNPHYGAVFYRGAPAVSFFFTLSGFLITYLLLDERRRTGQIAVGNFYMRRVLRIWPLYFLIVGFGLIFYNLALPRLGIAHPLEYNIWLAIFLYVLFLPNLMNSLYSVGGILNPTWSIGIEEQFYLLWAPVVKRWHHRLLFICGTILAVSLLVFALNRVNLFGLQETQKFLAQLKFHFMAAGAIIAWMLFHQPARLFALPLFRWRWLQWVLALLLLEFFLVGSARPWLLEESLQILLYGWLIVEVAVNPHRLVKMKTRLTERLGEISYGIYMYHMIAVYVTSFYFQRAQWWRTNPVLYVITYYLLAIGLTVLLAYLSHRFFERPILQLKRRFSY
jgi:peptidoglycan/LPS O-acetylase OafA/YrhL